MCFKNKLDLSPIDYSNKNNWAEIDDTNKDVDVFFIVPTLVMESKYGDFASVEELRKEAGIIVTTMVSAYKDSCNTYVPLYRQVAFSKATKCGPDNKAFLDVVYNGVTYKDIVDALDYYFKNYNKGKPFILAGHSQGSAICTDLLQYYFQEHPEYLKLMVASYLIGFAPSKKMIDKCKGIKFATGEKDAGGVIISWNTEGPNASGKSILVAEEEPLVINPLNWKLDDTYADVSSNKGSFLLGKGGLTTGVADAQINLKRKTVICTTIDRWTEAPGVFQSCSLHELDYGLYYVNLKENIKVRIENFKKM